VTLKLIQPEYALLLTRLIIEHHQLYLKLFNTNLKPKHHYLLHYPYIMRNVDQYLIYGLYVMSQKIENPN